MSCPSMLHVLGCCDRQNGVLEIMGSGLTLPGMVDMLVATLIGMLEWRKHNNKVWIILLAAMPG